MDHDSIKYLHDIIDSISKIDFHLKDITSSDQFTNNITIVDAVERRLAIIGEALWKASKIDSSISVTDQKKVIGLRHIIIHDYDLVDKPTLWRIATNNLPLLKQEIQNIIDKLDGHTIN